MKTALVSHAWLDCPLPGYRNADGVGCRRVERWLEQYKDWDYPKIIIDNGSDPVTAAQWAFWWKVSVINSQPHYESNSVAWQYPHVWRNYWTIKEILKQYERVFFIATDAYVLSDRLRKWLEEQTEGWAALWCPRYNFPEPCIQVITNCRQFELFTTGEWTPERFEGVCEEITLPFSRVETSFKGDRYGESPYEEWPDHLTLDYFCQVPD